MYIQGEMLLQAMSVNGRHIPVGIWIEQKTENISIICSKKALEKKGASLRYFEFINSNTKIFAFIQTQYTQDGKDGNLTDTTHY